LTITSLRSDAHAAGGYAVIIIVAIVLILGIQAAWMRYTD